MNGKPWQPGQSGNPAGRPKGTKNKKTILREQIEQFGPELMEIIKGAARGGENRSPDMSAALALLARLEPVMRQRGEIVEFELDTTLSLSKQCEQVIKAVAAGEVTVEEGKQITDSLRQLAEIRALEGEGGDKAERVVAAFKELAKVVDRDGTPYRPRGSAAASDEPQVPQPTLWQ
jgi:hypothetical protein